MRLSLSNHLGRHGSAAGGSNPVATALPAITGTPYPGGSYIMFEGLWTNSPTLTLMLQQSADGVTGWTDVGDPGVSGTFAAAQASKVLRLKVTPNGNAALAAYSANFGPLGLAYAQVLDLAGTGNWLDANFSAFTAGANWTAGRANGFWIAAQFYNPGSGLESASGLISLGSSAASNVLANLSPTIAQINNTGSAASADNTALLGGAGWANATAHFWKPAAGTFNATHLLGSTETDGTAQSGSWTLSSFADGRIGARAGLSPSNAQNNDWPIAWVAWGYGDPAPAHLWAYNNGELRNIWDYPGFGGSLTCEGYALLSRVNPGNTTFTASEVFDAIGSIDTWTQTGALAWANRLPGFINPAGDPPNNAQVYIHPAFAPTGDTFTLCANTAKIGEATPAGFTITTLTHSVLGDISGTVSAGQFTCATAGTITYNLSYTGGLTATGTVEVIAPRALPANPLFTSLYGGNGRIAGIAPYADPGAGTTYATVSDLKTAIDGLAAGGTLIVNNLTETGTTLTLTAKDYGGATIVAKNLHGVNIGALVANGASNITIRGFKAVGSFSATSSTGVTFDYCRGTFVTASGKSSSTSTFVWSNWAGYDDGTASQNTITSFNRLSILSVAHGNTMTGGTDNDDDIKISAINTLIMDRVYFGENNKADPLAHVDLLQSTAGGAQGYTQGLIMNSVGIDLDATNNAPQGFFLKDTYLRNFAIWRSIMRQPSPNSFYIDRAVQNVSVRECFASGSISFKSNSSALSSLVANVVKGAAGSCLASSGLGVETGVVADLATLGFTTVFPQYNSHQATWEAFDNPAGGYTSAGPYALIAELKANKTAYP